MKTSAPPTLLSVNTSRIPVPMKGLCYQPAPLDYIGNQGPTQKYFDTDFFNTDFPGFWSSAGCGRGDLAAMANLGANFLHLYDWNPQRNHSTFLAECAACNLFVAVPINNSFCTNLYTWGAQGIYNIMKEIYTLGGGTMPYSQVAMWTIANEYNQGGGPTAEQIAQVAQIIFYVETNLLNSELALPISSPTSFAPAEKPGIEPTLKIQKAFKNTRAFTVTINNTSISIPALPLNFFTNRYVAATNPQNPGSTPPAASGITIQSWLPAFRESFPNTPVWFSEIGVGEQNCCTGYDTSTCVTGPLQQALFTSNQIQNADPAQYPYLLGSCVFEYTPDYQNVPVGSNNYTFSLMSDNNETSTPVLNFTIPAGAPHGVGQIYPVQPLLSNKPVYAAVKTLWNPTKAFTIQANKNWQNTGLFVRQGSTLTITYQNGTWTADPKTNGGNLYDAKGCPGVIADLPGYTLRKVNMGAVCGYIGIQPKGDGSDKAFLVGNSYNGLCATSGMLWLCMNDDLKGFYGAGLTDNSGSVSCQLELTTNSVEVNKTQLQAMSAA